MTLGRARRLAAEIERELPSASLDATKYTRALLHQLSRRRTLTRFESCLLDLLESELRGDSEDDLSHLLLRAVRALKDEAHA